MANQDIPGGTNKSLRTQLLWQLSLLRSCAWGRLWYPRGEGVGVTRSEEQSPTWDFSQPQLDRARDWWGMETFFAITSIPPSPSQRTERDAYMYYLWQWTNPRHPAEQAPWPALACAWACIEISSHTSLWDQCPRGRTENAARIFSKNQHLTKYPETRFSARSYAAPGWTENSLLLWLPLALNLFTTPCWTAAKENKNIHNTCNCLVHILTFLFGGCFKLCSNIAGMLLQSPFPKRIHFTVLKLDTGCKNHTFEYFFQ